MALCRMSFCAGPFIQTLYFYMFSYHLPICAGLRFFLFAASFSTVCRSTYQPVCQFIFMRLPLWSFSTQTPAPPKKEPRHSTRVRVPSLDCVLCWWVFCRLVLLLCWLVFLLSWLVCWWVFSWSIILD